MNGKTERAPTDESIILNSSTSPAWLKFATRTPLGQMLYFYTIQAGWSALTRRQTVSWPGAGILAALAISTKRPLI